VQARFDKLGRRLADTGRGCGCQQCADAGAPRYERRAPPEDRGGARSAVGWRSSSAAFAARWPDQEKGPGRAGQAL